jgi:cephalosporin-C deacetylase-like acetyl esterase
MKQSLQNFFYELNRKGDDLNNAMQDISDVCADKALLDSPAIINLLRKVQYVMDRAAASMRHTKQEEEDVENATYDTSNLLQIRENEITKLKERIEVLQAQLPLEDGLTKPEREFAMHNAIEAIKLVRLRTGWGLKESKDLVEKYREIHNIPPRKVTP